MALVEKKKQKKAPKMNVLEKEKTTKEVKNETFDARPSIYFNEKELPAIKDWSVGKTYKVEIEIEQTGMRVIDYGENKGKIEATFRVSKVGVEDKD